MAQHDYVISNGTGASVRSDLNNALLAIVSNNSGATAPSPTYAYQLWADTTTNTLKLRNGANSAWISLGDLTAANLGLATLASPTFTGTVTIPTASISTGMGLALGSASSPTVYFTGDTNTGIYSPGADQIAFSTGGTGRLFVDSSGRLGLGTSTVSYKLHVQDATTTDVMIQAGSSGSDANRRATLNFLTSGSKLFKIQADASDNSLKIIDDSTARVTISNTGAVGIGTTSPSSPLTINNDGVGFRIERGSAVGFLYHTGTTNSTDLQLQSQGGLNLFTESGNSQPIKFSPAGTERARLTSDGKFLVGTSSAPGSDSTYSRLNVVGNTYGGNAPGEISILTATSAASVNYSGSQIGVIRFGDVNGNPFARIECVGDAATSAGDFPGRLAFYTTADGASTATERLRITNGGILRATQSGGYNETANLPGHYFQNDNNSANGFIAWNNSYEATVIQTNCLRAANSIYNFYYAASGNGSTAYADTEFKLRGDGNAYCDGSWSGGGADYAEYFEWSDGNPDDEDRRGISVVLDGDQIRPAIDGEDPIGVISGNPSVVGDAAWNKWSGKYLRDDYGTYIQEDYEVVNDEGETVVQQRRKLNPAYDPDQEYVSREQRPEWDCVGLMGKLRIRKGQPTGSRWIKMRDISDSVEEWLVR